MRKLLGIWVLVGAVALAGAAMAQKETRGVTKTEIVLGMHTDLSGPAATYGVSSSNAVRMRFDEANEKGGVRGRKIRLIVEDTQYQVPRAVQAGAKLINRDGIFAMVAALGTPMNWVLRIARNRAMLISRVSFTRSTLRRIQAASPSAEAPAARATPATSANVTVSRLGIAASSSSFAITPRPR